MVNVYGREFSERGDSVWTRGQRAVGLYEIVEMLFVDLLGSFWYLHF